MQKRDYIFIISSFLIWRFLVIIFALLSTKFVPLFSNSYLGGGFSNYITNPVFWGHLNFDGEHYLSIAQNGYQPLQYFFFPFFPKLISYLTVVRTQIGFAWTGLIISNLSFVIALVGIYKLVKLDFDNMVAKLTIVLILVFPTSFYFGAYYNESIFLALIIWSFYFARKNNFLFASILAGLASATRIIGVIMFGALILEFLQQKKFKVKLGDFKDFWSILISPFGLLLYMYYLLKKTGDSLIFLHQISVFGEQRSSMLITLPQVFYRYIFEILPHVSYSYFPNVFTTYLEFILTILFLIVIIFGIFKLRLSYSLFSVLAFIIPTLSGSFSSMPRYALVIFPIFIIVASYLNKLSKTYKYFVIFAMLILMVVSTCMFWTGYWIS